MPIRMYVHYKSGKLLTCAKKLQRHKNVTYVGDYQTGSPLEWNWNWRPIADVQSNGPTGHRSFCCVYHPYLAFTYYSLLNTHSVRTALSCWHHYPSGWKVLQMLRRR